MRFYKKETKKKTHKKLGGGDADLSRLKFSRLLSLLSLRILGGLLLGDRPLCGWNLLFLLSLRGDGDRLLDLDLVGGVFDLTGGRTLGLLLRLLDFER